jgi:hypothetical protein
VRQHEVLKKLAELTKKINNDYKYHTKMKRVFLAVMAMSVVTGVWAQGGQSNPNSNHANKFEQLGTLLPTPNEYRTASGAPGPKYWQQRADYNIKCTLDEKALKLTGSETITYYNNSPDVLTYIWLQLDENEHSSVNNAGYQVSSSLPKQTSVQQLQAMEAATDKKDNGFGINITKLTDATGKKLESVLNKTMLRIDLPAPAEAGTEIYF